MAEANGKSDQAIYHERQRLQMCAIHAINNMFQGNKLLRREDMNNVCKELSPSTLVNPHKSSFGVGNYDINAIMAVLSKRGYEIVWFDKRRSLEDINFENVYGILINTVAKLDAFGFKVAIKMFRHWYALKKLDNFYYNLDSKLKEPEKIGSEVDLKEYLTLLAKTKTELLLVVEKTVADERTWENPKGASGVTTT